MLALQLEVAVWGFLLEMLSKSVVVLKVHHQIRIQGQEMAVALQEAAAEELLLV